MLKYFSISRSFLIPYDTRENFVCDVNNIMERISKHTQIHILARYAYLYQFNDIFYSRGLIINIDFGIKPMN